jgi:hypothetical protein
MRHPGPIAVAPAGAADGQGRYDRPAPARRLDPALRIPGRLQGQKRAESDAGLAGRLGPVTIVAEIADR